MDKRTKGLAFCTESGSYLGALCLEAVSFDASLARPVADAASFAFPHSIFSLSKFCPTPSNVAAFIFCSNVAAFIFCSNVAAFIFCSTAPSQPENVRFFVEHRRGDPLQEVS